MKKRRYSVPIGAPLRDRCGQQAGAGAVREKGRAPLGCPAIRLPKPVGPALAIDTYQLMRDTSWMTRLVFVPVNVVTR